MSRPISMSLDGVDITDDVRDVSISWEDPDTTMIREFGMTFAEAEQAVRRFSIVFQAVTDSARSWFEWWNEHMAPLFEVPSHEDQVRWWAVEYAGVAESDLWKVDPVEPIVQLRNWRRVDMRAHGWADDEEDDEWT